MVKLSVIIPVYGTEKYLKKCLDSVVNQTLSDIEIICINDCSPDNAETVLQEYAQKDNRVKIINFEENKGVSIARNEGINKAVGEYIGFIDSDDSVEFDFYEKLYRKAKETNAPIVKGNVYYVGEEYKTPELSDFYNQNDLIRKNKSNFLYGFTSAIYKTEMVKKNSIYFPENITHFEDPYFSIKASIVADKVELVDDAKYLYFKHSDSACENVKIPKKVQDLIKTILMIADIINKYDLPDEDYLIYYGFLIKQITPWCCDAEMDEETNSMAIDGLISLMDKSGKNKRAVLHGYFMYNRTIALNQIKEHKAKMMECVRKKIKEKEKGRILLKQYKKYDCLNKDLQKPLVKILVSYIKPAFLFKSDILVPIHLGSAVENEESKDGVPTDYDINWLHSNCISDDFEGGISKHNRRIGFLTGTYKAWKHYDELGNPDYFGSMGYRKLLPPAFLDNLDKYDLILPCKDAYPYTLKEQVIDWHGEEYYNILIDVIKNLYPDELELMDDYMSQFSGYFAEMYVMKKGLFFEFCDWIFKIVDYMLKTYPNFIPQNHKYLRYLNNLEICDEDINENLGDEVEFEKNEYRDLAFILERLSGYYFYKLTKRNGLKYRELRMIKL